MIKEITDILNDWAKRELPETKVYWLLHIIYQRGKDYYNHIWISRKEIVKLKFSEARIARIIKKLLAIGFFEPIWKWRNDKWQPCNIYKITKNFVWDFACAVRNYSNRKMKFVSELNEKILKWCQDTDYRRFLIDSWAYYGINVSEEETRYGWQNQIQIWRDYEEQVFACENYIRDFRNGVTYNLFDYLKKVSGMKSKDLVFKLRIGW